MKQIMCSVFDSASITFSRPFCVAARGQAIRTFSDEVNRVDPGNELNRHPDDFSLHVVGEFDDNTGCLYPQDAECLIRGKDCVTPRKE